MSSTVGSLSVSEKSSIFPEEFQNPDKKNLACIVSGKNQNVSIPFNRNGNRRCHARPIKEEGLSPSLSTTAAKLLETVRNGLESGRRECFSLG